MHRSLKNVLVIKVTFEKEIPCNDTFFLFDHGYVSLKRTTNIEEHCFISHLFLTAIDTYILKYMEMSAGPTGAFFL